MKLPAKIILLISLFLLMGITLNACKDKSGSEYQPPAKQAPNLKPIRVDSDISMLKDLVVKEPENLNAWIKLGNLQMDTGRFQDAVVSYTRALELDPKNADVRVDMGTCYRNSGNPQKAVEEYRKALKYNPKHLFAHKNLAVVLAYDLNRIKEAITEFRTYLKLSPNAPDAHQVKQAIRELGERL